MKQWTKENAIAEIERLVGLISELKKQRRQSSDHIRWKANCLEMLEEVFGQESRYYFSFADIKWEKTGEIIVGGPGDEFGSWNPGEAVEREHQKAFVYSLDAAKGLLHGAHDRLMRLDITEVYEGKNTPPESSEIIKIIDLCDRQLRKTIRDKPEKEKQV